MEYLVQFFRLGFRLAKQALGFTNLNAETATFSSDDMIVQSGDDATRQLMTKVVNNTGFNWRHSDQAMLIENDQYGPGTEREYDPGRDYEGSYVMYFAESRTSPEALPHTWDYPDNVAYLFLSTSYQPADDIMAIRAVAGGGFRIRNDHPSDTYWLTGVIFELYHPMSVLV